MTTNNQKIQEALNKIYKILKFTEAETKDALSDLAGIQQVAVATELIKVLNADEVKTLNDLAQKTDEEKKAAMKQIAKAHENDEDFKSWAQAVAKKVIDDHIAYLKTRGDKDQKAEIAKILAEIE
jgi:polyribonucleotide nucleotidyltransferase